MKYRSDIDGMRCLAVVSVILFHLDERIVPGGFTGVDIFFVLSGFLITRIIVDGLEKGSFSITRFYARRVRRIFPALFFVLLASIALAVVAFEPEAYKTFFDDLPYAIFQASNFLFVQQTGYFDPANESSPLLHTWSLGVEEQFYLIWPFLLITIYRLCKKRTTLILGAIAILSFAYSQYLCLHSPKIAFYMLHSRAWELALGGLLVVANIPEIRSRTTNNILAAAGLALVGAGFVFVDSTSPFPGVNALPPVLGTVLMLLSGQSSNSFLYKLLSWRPFVAVGLISYSLYLWHWPLIVFTKSVTGAEIGFIIGCGLFLASMVMAVCSFYLVERPLRYGKLPRWPQGLFEKLGAIHRPSLRGLAYAAFWLLLPALLSIVFISSARFEHNGAATTLQMDVELLESGRGAAGEKIAVYWRDRKSPFSAENSVSQSYDNENKVTDKHYRFQFEIPDLQHLKSIRLDPLTGEGKVRIDSITLTGGFFRIPVNVGMEALGKSISGESADILQILYQNGLLIESGGRDPYFELFSPPPVQSYDFLLVFTCVLLLFFFFWGYAQLLRREMLNRAVLSGGLIAITVTLLLALRLNYSNYSQWRFADEKNSEFLLAATAMTEMNQFSDSMTSNAVLLGDSHAQYYALPVQRWSDKNGLSFGVFAQPACPPLLYNGIGAAGMDGLNATYQSCTKRNNKRMDTIRENPETKIVFISIRQAFYFANPSMFLSKKGFKLLNDSVSPDELLKESFASTVRSLTTSGKRVVLLGQTPVLKESPKKCLNRNVTLLSLPYRETDSCDLDKEQSEKRLRLGRNFFKQLAAESPLVDYFDTSRYIDSIFGANQTILYYDDNHLSHQGSLFISPHLENDLSAIGSSL